MKLTVSSTKEIAFVVDAFIVLLQSNNCIDNAWFAAPPLAIKLTALFTPFEPPFQVNLKLAPPLDIKFVNGVATGVKPKLILLSNVDNCIPLFCWANPALVSQAKPELLDNDCVPFQKAILV